MSNHRKIKKQAYLDILQSIEDSVYNLRLVVDADEFPPEWVSRINKIYMEIRQQKTELQKTEKLH